jgi:hypothetical protein
MTSDAYNDSSRLHRTALLERMLSPLYDPPLLAGTGHESLPHDGAV